MFGKKLSIKEEKDTWPGSREFIGTISGATGEYRVYVPSLKDAINAGLDLNSEQAKAEFHYRLSAASIGMEYDEFLNLPWNEVCAVLDLVSKAMQRLKPVISTTNQQS